MTQCPYTTELNKNEDKTVTVGRYGDTLIGTGHTYHSRVIEHVNKVAEELGLTDLTEYNLMEDGHGTVAVTLGRVQLTNPEIWEYLHKLYDQDLACANCNMSGAMDEWHGKPRRVPEKVTLGENQILAYGSVQDLMTYEKAAEGIRWYLEKTGDRGCAMLADIGYSGYEIVLHHVEIDGVHYAGDSDYVSVADAQRLVDEGLAEYMEMDYS